jgi:carboxyl-terminal processing protease
VDGFVREQDVSADLAMRGDVSFGRKVFRRFLERVDERLKTAEELIAGPHDFTLDERIAVDTRDLNYSKTPEEARERLRKQIKLELLILKTAEDPKERMEGSKAVEKLLNRYRSRAKLLHQTGDDEVLELYLNALTTSFDPHSCYLSPETQKNLQIMMERKLEGIGATLQSIDGKVTVKDLVPRGAAAESGLLHAEDQIVGVGQGKDGPLTDVVNMKINQVVKLIRGEPGSTIRLKIVPADGSGKKEIELVRRKIELTDSKAEGEVFEAGRRSDGSPHKIGLINLPGIYDKAAQDVRAILKDFGKQGVEAVVLDLRFNGGGSLTDTIELAGLFLRQGPVVQLKDAQGRVRALQVDHSKLAWSGPLVVMVNQLTSSGCEIFTGAIQDYGRGLIVGDPSTQGKGTMQNLVKLNEGVAGNKALQGAVKLTKEQCFRLSGEGLQKRGVHSDIVLPSLAAHYEASEADLDYSLDPGRVEPLAHEDWGLVTPALREPLKKLSAERVAKSEKFQRLERLIDRYEEQKAKKSVSLNEKQYLKERGGLDAVEDEKEIAEVLSQPPGRVKIDRDFYLDEVLAIAADCINLRKSAATP